MNKESIMQKHAALIIQAEQLESQAANLRAMAATVKSDALQAMSGITPNKTVIQNGSERWLVTKLSSYTWKLGKASVGRKIKNDGTPGIREAYILRGDHKNEDVIIGEWDGKQIVEIAK